jgi:hypothetical protein
MKNCRGKEMRSCKKEVVRKAFVNESMTVRINHDDK